MIFGGYVSYDQGSEMALHQTLSADLKMDIFLCDPHSPWQRGSNENANGLVREFRPLGMDLSQVSHQQLTPIEHLLDKRPGNIDDHLGVQRKVGSMSNTDESAKRCPTRAAGAAAFLVSLARACGGAGP